MDFIKNWILKKALSKLSRNATTTLLGIFMILGGISNAAIAALDDDPATEVNWELVGSLMGGGVVAIKAREESQHQKDKEEAKKANNSPYVRAILGGLVILASVAAVPAQAQQYALELGYGAYASTIPHSAGYLTFLRGFGEDKKTRSYTTLEMRGPMEQQPIYSSRTGIERAIFQNKRVELNTLAQAGLAVNESASALAVSGGGSLQIKLKYGLLLALGGEAFHAATAGGWQPQLKLGLRYTLEP